MTHFKKLVFNEHLISALLLKGDTKCGKWGGLGVVNGHSRSLEIAPFLIFFCFCAVRYTKLAFLSAFERT